MSSKLGFCDFVILDFILCLRAKPIISMEKTLTLTPREINFQEGDCQKGHWWGKNTHTKNKLFAVQFFIFILDFGKCVWHFYLMPTWKSFSVITAESCFSYTTYPETYNPRLGECNTVWLWTYKLNGALQKDVLWFPLTSQEVDSLSKMWMYSMCARCPVMHWHPIHPHQDKAVTKLV